MGKEEKKGEASRIEDVSDSPMRTKGKGRADDLTKTSTATSGKIDLVHLEDVQDEKMPKLNKKQKFRRHCVRFWLCYVIGAVVLLAIGLPILFLVIVPALAQRIVDDTSLPIFGGSLMAVSNDAVKIGLNTALTVPGGLSVRLEALELWLYNEATDDFKPWSMVPLEGQTVSGRTEINVQDQVVGVGDRDEIHTWLTGMLYNDTADISAKGNTTAHLGALNFDISLDKTVTIDGLRKLEGFGLTSSQLLLPPRDNGINIVGNTTLPNWSILTLGLGNLTFNAWAGELLIGNVAVYDVVLEPGNSTLPFEGELFLSTIFDNLVEIIGSQSLVLGTGSLEVGISGNSTIVDGEHIMYLQNVLNDAHILSQVPIVQLLTDVLASVRDGHISLDGLLDVASDALGPLLDDLLGGLGGGDGENEGASRIPVDDILGDLLDDLDEDDSGGGGDEEDDGGDDEDSPLGSLLDGLGMRSTVARGRVSDTWRRLKQGNRIGRDV